MSYVRFGEADVYVYADVGGYLCCCGCSLSEDWEHYSTDELITHLREHQKAGHDVPDFVFEDLLTDKVDNDQWIVESQLARTAEEVQAAMDSKAPSSRFRKAFGEWIEEESLLTDEQKEIALSSLNRVRT